MRWISANLLLAFYAIALIFPAFAAPDSRLPACCRRAGKHHCAMDQDSSHGPGARAIAERCPYVSGSTATQAAPDRFAVQPTQAAALYIPREVFVPAEAEARERVPFNRATRQRGPPDLDA